MILNHRDDCLSTCRNGLVLPKSYVADICAFYSRIEVILSAKLACKQHYDNNPISSWTYVSYSNKNFIEMLQYAIKVVKKDMPRFLDIGCGFGMKCWLAHRLGLESVGIDLCKNYVQLAKEIFKGNCWSGSKPIRIKCVDALRYKGYNEYDIIYMCQPIRHHVPMSNLVDCVVEKMKPGSLLLAILFLDNFPNSLKNMDRLTSSIWQKK